VGRKKSTPKAAAAPSPTSSRKRRSKHQNGGASKRNVSRSKDKLQVDNTTDLDGVDTSNEIKSTRSNQNYKNDYGLYNKLSNFNYKTVTNNNKNNNVSKAPNINEENNNRSGSTPASPKRTLKKSILLPSPNRGNGNNNSGDVGSSAGSIKSILSPPLRRKSSRRRSLGAPQQSKNHTSGSTKHKQPQEGNIGIGDSISTNGVQHNGSSNYVTKLMFANKNVLKIIPTLRQKAKEGYPLCAQAVKEFELLEYRDLDDAIANESAPEIKKEFRECSYKYANLLGLIANRGQDLPDDLEKSAIGIMTLFATKSCMNFVNESFTPDKMNPLNSCLAWLGGHMVYSALLQAGTDSSVLNHAQVGRDFLAQNSAMFDALGACNTGNDIDPKHPDKDVRKKADPKGNKFETIEVQLVKIAEGELCGLTGSDCMKFWKFFALLFMAWRGQYYYVKSGGKQYTLVEASFTAANFCQDNPDRKVLENQYMKILTLTMYMMPNRTTYPPPVVVELDRHFQILLDILHGKLLPDGETEVVASGMTTYFQQRAKLLTRDGNAIDDPTTDLTMAWKDAKLYKFNLSELSVERRAILEESPIFLKCAARRLLLECEIITLPIADGTIGITFEKLPDSFVCTVTVVHVDPSPFQVGDIILSLNDTLLFDKSSSQIGRLIRNSTNRSVVLIRPPKLVQKQIEGDESLQCLIQVRSLLSGVDQQSPPSIQKFVENAEAIFSCGKGSPDGKVRSTTGYDNAHLASATKSSRWSTFLGAVDDPLKSLIKEAKKKLSSTSTRYQP